MAKQFSIYNSGRDRNFPKAAEELKVEITLIDEQGASLFGLLNTGKVFGTVVGYLSKEFEYNATGNYSNIFDVKCNNSLLGKILEDEVQGNIANYGYLTKKMYHNGDSPTIDISFRCYAGAASPKYSLNPTEGMVNPVQIANVLINATLPRVGKNGLLNFTSLSTLKDSNTPIGNALKSFSPDSNGLNAASTAGDVVNAGVKTVGGVFDAVSNVKLSDLISKKPPVCNVKIGNIFEKSMMVVKTVSVKFSKEFLREGVPLYADFDVTLQSLFNSSTLENGTDSNTEKIFGSGLNGNTSKGSRVSFDYSTESPTIAEVQNKLPTNADVRRGVANSAPGDTTKNTADIYNRNGNSRDFGGTF